MMTILPSLCAAVAAVTGAPQWDDAPSRIRWSNPSVFSAVPKAEKDVYITPGARYGEYKGRKAEFEELTVGGYVLNNVELWYSKLDMLMKGQTVARFRSNAYSFGGRWYFQPNNIERLAMAVEFETMKSDRGVATAPGSSATFVGPETWSIRWIGSNEKVDLLASYTNAKVDNSLKSNVFELGLGRDLPLSDRLAMRLQGSLVAENIDREFDAVNFEVKPVFYGALSYRVHGNARIELDGTVMPFGVPIAHGRDTGFTAYQLHNLTGPAAGIRDDPFALVSLRVNLSIRY